MCVWLRGWKNLLFGGEENWDNGKYSLYKFTLILLLNKKVRNYIFIKILCMNVHFIKKKKKGKKDEKKFKKPRQMRKDKKIKEIQTREK